MGMLEILNPLRPFMRIIAKKTLKIFWAKHPLSEQALTTRYREVSKAKRKAPNDLIKDYPTASVVKNNRAVFRIK